MKAGSMEGLIGASVNMELTRTPMRVYKEAERRGDTAVMERAMGYVTEFEDKAKEYGDKVLEELQKERKEERKEQEMKREEALARKEEAQAYVDRIRENSKPDMPQADSVEISEEGKAALEQSLQTKEGVSLSENDDINLTLFEGVSEIPRQPL